MPMPNLVTKKAAFKNIIKLFDQKFSKIHKDDDFDLFLTKNQKIGFFDII